MIKRIGIDQLQPGMYVQDLNCGWTDHPLPKLQFRVENETMLLKIRGLGIRALYIDTERGLDVTTDAPSASEVKAQLERELAAIASQEPSGSEPVPGAREWARASRIRQEAQRIVTDIMEDVRLGRMVDAERAAPVVDDLMNSMFRNQDALLGLTRIRRMHQYTFEHSVSVSVLLIAFARALDLEVPVIREIGIGALLHDIGKIRVPPEIHDKPGRLTEDELVVMRQHVVYSREILSAMPDIPATALAVAAEHHERHDGTGYPEGRRDGDISRHGQMAGIVDVYDAITSDRVYHRALVPHEALRRLLEWSSHHFDPVLVQRFIQCVGVYPVGSLVRLASQRLGVVVESNRSDRLQPVVRLVLDLHQRRHLTPRDLDLARQPAGEHDRITGVESPEHWPVDPAHVLGRPA